MAEIFQLKHTSSFRWICSKDSIVIRSKSSDLMLTLDLSLSELISFTIDEQFSLFKKDKLLNKIDLLNFILNKMKRESKVFKWNKSQLYSHSIVFRRRLRQCETQKDIFSLIHSDRDLSYLNQKYKILDIYMPEITYLKKDLLEINANFQ